LKAIVVVLAGSSHGRTEETDDAMLPYDLTYFTSEMDNEGDDAGAAGKG